MAQTKRETYWLAHDFDPGLSKRASKLLNVKAYSVKFALEYDVGKDADNRVLIKDIERVWSAFCKVRAIKFQKEVEALATLMSVKLFKLADENGVITVHADAMNMLIDLVQRHNQKMEDAFQKWIEGFTREVLMISGKWSSVNDDCLLVRTKRVGKVAGDIAGIVHTVLNPLSIKGKLKLVSKFRNLYNDVKSSYGSADRRARRVVAELGKMQKVINTVDASSKAGKLIKWSAKFNSVGTDLKRAIDDYEAEVKVMKSKVKKLGAKLRDLENSDKADTPKKIADTMAKMVKMEAALSGHILTLGAAKKQKDVFQVSLDLSTWSEKKRKKFMAAAGSVFSDVDKYVRKDLSTMSSLTFLDHEIVTLENGFSAHSRGAVLQL